MKFMNNNMMQENLCEDIQYYSNDPNTTYKKDDTVYAAAPTIKIKR